MAPYTCDRCHHNFSQKTGLIRHLNRKMLCKAIYDNVDAKTLLSLLDVNKVHKCDYCNKSYQVFSCLKRHHKKCVEYLKEKVQTRRRKNQGVGKSA